MSKKKKKKKLRLELAEALLGKASQEIGEVLDAPPTVPHATATEEGKRSPGRPRLAAPKAAVTLRLDPATLAKFKATGPTWRAQMAKILDKAKV